MTCPRLDHYGFSVGTEAELDEMLERAKAFQTRRPRVDIVDKHVDDHGMLAITSFYVGLPAADDGRDPVVGLQGGRGAAGLTRTASINGRAAAIRRVRAAGLEARVHGLERGRRVGPHRRASRSSPSRSATTTSGSTTTSRPCRAASRRTCSRRSRRSPRCRNVRERIRLGQLVTCAAYRNAGAARQGGRGRRRDVGRSAHPRPRRAAGTSASTRRTATRIRPRASGLRDPRGDGRGGAAAVDARRRSTTRAGTCSSTARTAIPKPLQQLPEVWIGGGGEQVTLRIAARHADKTNWQVGLDQFVHKSEVLRGALRARGARLRHDRAHPRARLPPLRLRARPRRVARVARRRPPAQADRRRTPTAATTSSARRSRWPRRCRRSSTPGCREFVLWFRDVTVDGEPRAVRGRGDSPRPRLSERVRGRILSAPVAAPVKSDERVEPVADRRDRCWSRSGSASCSSSPSVLRFVASSDLWLDEALSVNIAQLPLGDLHAALKRDGAPPLYYVLLHFWIGLCSATSDTAVRGLSGVLSVATFPAMYFIGKPVGGRFTAWVAVLLVRRRCRTRSGTAARRACTRSSCSSSCGATSRSYVRSSGRRSVAWRS